MQPPVIIMRGNDICYLGILRSCRAAGLSTVSVTFTWSGAKPWYSELSNCLEEHYEIANPYVSPERARNEFELILKALHRRYQKKLLFLPSSDTNYMFVLDNFELFSRYMFLMGDRDFSAPRYDVMHKGECARLLAEGCSDLVPQTFRCQALDDIDDIVAKIQYPAVYKPAVKDYGQTFYTSHNGNKAVECGSADQLRDLLRDEVKAGFDLIVQEKILFDSVYDEIPFYLYSDASGQVVMASNGIKEVIEPFPFGTAIVLRLAWFPELLDCARRVVAALKYRGILMIEFVKDKRDGRWKVIEVNPRHWLFNGFYSRQGLNYTAALANDINSVEFGHLVTPAKNATDNIHIDLTACAVKEAKTQKALSIGKYLDTLSELEGKVSDPYCFEKDLAPGEACVASLVDRYGWDPSVNEHILSAMCHI